MTLRVLLFDTLRQSLGPEVTAEVPEGATGADLLDRLAADHPIIARHRPTIQLAVNLRYARLATVLSRGRRGRADHARQRGLAHVRVGGVRPDDLSLGQDVPVQGVLHVGAAEVAAAIEV